MPTETDIAHLLRRTETVVRPERLAALVALPSLEAAVDDVLDIAQNPDDTPPEFLRTHVDGMSWQQAVAALQWWMDRMVDVPRPIGEKLTMFWHGHFVSSWWKVGRTDAMVGQNRLFRRHALGDLRVMAQEMAIQPAMLLYLDNAENTRWSPNQNFARELLELFLLGVGNYTEADVEAAAAAWTGHNIDWNTYQYLYRPQQHDDSVKTFFGTAKRWNGPDTIDEVLRDNPAKQLVAARFISRKLWEFFAHQNPSETVVSELAAVMVANGMQIRPVVRALLLRTEFYSPTAREGMVRTPTDYAVALMYHLGIRSATWHPEWFMEDMGQVPFAPPNVSGWRPNGYFVNTTTWGGRAGLARSLTWGLREGNRFGEITRMTPDQAIDHIAAVFGLATGDRPLAESTRAALRTWMAAERTAEPWGGWWQPTNLLTMMMLAPELHVA